MVTDRRLWYCWRSHCLVSEGDDRCRGPFRYGAQDIVASDSVYTETSDHGRYGVICAVAGRYYFWARYERVVSNGGAAHLRSFRLVCYLS